MKLNLDEYFCPIPGKENESDIVVFSRRHWVSLLGQIVLTIMMVVLPIIVIIAIQALNGHVYQGNARNFIVVGLSIYYLVVVTFSFAAWISYYYDLYIVTKDTIVDITQMSFFGRKISQLSLLRVQDVSSNIKGILPTLFAYGDVLIETAGESENFLLVAVPNPQKFSAKVLELHNQLIEKEGRHQEMLEGEGVIPPGVMKRPEAQPAEPSQPEEKTSYRQLLEKDMQNKPQNALEPASYEAEEEKQGEISKDDLNKGGEVKF